MAQISLYVLGKPKVNSEYYLTFKSIFQCKKQRISSCFFGIVLLLNEEILEFNVLVYV